VAGEAVEAGLESLGLDSVDLDSDGFDSPDVDSDGLEPVDFSDSIAFFRDSEG
jgi:hypothetical protein